MRTFSNSQTEYLYYTLQRDNLDLTYSAYAMYFTSSDTDKRVQYEAEDMSIYPQFYQKLAVDKLELLPLGTWYLTMRSVNDLTTVVYNGAVRVTA